MTGEDGRRGTERMKKKKMADSRTEKEKYRIPFSSGYWSSFQDFH